MLEQDTLKVTADAGYSNGEQFAACEQPQIEAYVPANRSVNNQGEEPLLIAHNFIMSQRLIAFAVPMARPWRKQMNKGAIIYAAHESDCHACPLKSQCTQASKRYLNIYAHEDAFTPMQVRLQERPDIMSLRRTIDEHPLGNPKQWIFGNGRFLLWGLAGAETEMALGCMAYNLKRALNILGIQKMMALLT